MWAGTRPEPPLHELDPRTLATYTVAISGVLALLASGYGVARRVYPGFGWWTASLVLVSLALASVALRGAIGGPLIDYGPSAFGMAAMLAVLRGQLEFLPTGAVAPGPVAGALAAVGLAAMAACDLLGQPLLMSASGAVTVGALAVLAGAGFLRADGPLRGAARFCGAVLVGFGVVRLWRAGFLVAAPAGHDVLDPSLASTINYTANALFATLWCFGFILLNAARVEDELDASRRELERLAATDPLTGLRNRRAFFAEAENELRRARRHGLPVSALLIDLDHFKLVNDRFGHLAGDELLRQVAATLARELRTTDIHCRFGGEEFVALLVQTPAADVLPTAERLRRAIAALRIESLGQQVGTTVSIGTASVAAGDVELDELLRHADTALYRAKQAGRDRVVSA